MLVTNRRTRGNEPPFEPIIHDKNLSKSLEHFLIYELGYGGQITNLKEDEVSVRTFVMNCVDDTTFKWSEQDRAIMHDVIATYAAIKEEFKKESVQNVLIDQVMSVTGGNPLKIKLCSGVFMGNPPVKATLLQLINSEEHIEKLAKLSAKDLFTIFDLVYLDKQDIKEAMQLLN